MYNSFREKIEQYSNINQYLRYNGTLDCNYNHLTFKVNNLSEFISIIQELNQIPVYESESNILVYRGISTHSWEMTPSLQRVSSNLMNTENDIVNEFMTLRPEAFNNTMSSFEILAKMQHYGLPTRLLDFSTNSLIALYFACNENETIDGRVICSYSKLSRNTNEIRDVICDTAFRSDLSTKLLIDDLLQSYGMPLDKYLNQFYRKKYERPIFSIPLHSNQRIRNQSAIFLIFGNKLQDKQSKTIIDIEYLKKLDNESTKNYQDKFIIIDQLETMNINTMANEFCSILIDQSAKRNILRELESVGVKLDFVYPELEYTAKYIVKKYF